MPTNLKDIGRLTSKNQHSSRLSTAVGHKNFKMSHYIQATWDGNARSPGQTMGSSERLHDQDQVDVRLAAWSAQTPALSACSSQPWAWSSPWPLRLASPFPRVASSTSHSVGQTAWWTWLLWRTSSFVWFEEPWQRKCRPFSTHRPLHSSHGWLRQKRLQWLECRIDPPARAVSFYLSGSRGKQHITLSLRMFCRVCCFILLTN